MYRKYIGNPGAIKAGVQGAGGCDRVIRAFYGHKPLLRYSYRYSQGACLLKNKLGIAMPAGLAGCCAVVQPCESRLRHGLAQGYGADVGQQFRAGGGTHLVVNHPQFIALGADPVGSSPEQFTAFIRSETIKWGVAVKRAGITPE